MPIPRDRLRLRPEARSELLASTRTAHCGTVDAEGQPHVVPLWFVLFDGDLFVNSLRRSRRGANLREGSPVSLCIDAGDEYGELRGLVLNGRFEPVADGRVLNQVRTAFGAKYWRGADVPDLESHEWFRMITEREVSWDFRRIGEAGRDRRLQALEARDSEEDPGSG